jgi:hypothetical protein
LKTAKALAFVIGKNIEFKLEDGRVRYAEVGAFNAETLARFEAMLPLLWELADLAELETSM